MSSSLRPVAVVLALLTAVPALAQTQDDFFNPEVLQRVELWMNDDDWEKLKATFQENTYYPADMTWNGITVRNVGIRSRGLGSRRAAKPGLRVDFDRYSTRQEFLGPDNRPLPPVPALLNAGIILEGGIVSYDSNFLTGGIGARFLGIGADVEHRRDTIAVYLRAIAVKNGKMLTSVNVNKTIYSIGVSAGLTWVFNAFHVP